MIRTCEQPVRCVNPGLEGETWADVAILAIRQKDALEACNLRNGFPPEAED